MPTNNREPVKSPASKFGAMIGNLFEEIVVEFLAEYLSESYPEFIILGSEEGKALVTLDMLGGVSRQMDNVIALRDSTDPVALFETKWLKDARHHNDKGAWILQLREVRKNHATIRGAAAILAGYWTQGVGVMLMSEGGINMVLAATDEQLYSTLQTPLNEFLGEDSFILDPGSMRKSYEHPDKLVQLIWFLEDAERLKPIAQSWLNFERGNLPDGSIITGGDLIKTAVDKLLSPLPENPSITSYEITLHVDTGNIIHVRFSDVELALDFIQTYQKNPTAILEQITPKKNKVIQPKLI